MLLLTVTRLPQVTYPLHVVIRYEIEKALIEGSMEVRARDPAEGYNLRLCAAPRRPLILAWLGRLY